MLLGDGTRVHPRVVATYERSLGFGEVVMPMAMAAAHRTSALAPTILVRTAPGADRAAVARRLQALGGRYPGLHVADRAALASEGDTDRAAARWLNYVLVAIIVAFSAVAVINTLTMIALERSRELALMRLVGSTPRQVASMARWEAGLLVLVGLGLGSAIAAATLVPFEHRADGRRDALRPARPARRDPRRGGRARHGRQPAADAACPPREGGGRDRGARVGGSGRENPRPLCPHIGQSGRASEVPARAAIGLGQRSSASGPTRRQAG